jgi:hypothetical protein
MKSGAADEGASGIDHAPKLREAHPQPDHARSPGSPARPDLPGRGGITLRLRALTAIRECLPFPMSAMSCDDGDLGDLMRAP